MLQVAEAEALNEKVVAVLPDYRDEKEKRLTNSITAIEFQAESVVINGDEDYQAAAEFGRELKRKSAEVTAFFKPMKDAANKAHKEVCQRENAMLEPLKNAEGILKKEMGRYTMEQERQRAEMERQLRLAAQAEADKKLAEAAAAEEAGDKAGCEAALLDAQIIDTAGRSASLQVQAPKARGTSVSKDWQIVAVDDLLVPVAIAGVVIRPVDKGTVMRLIRSSKGTIQIPGVTYQETVKMSFKK